MSNILIILCVPGIVTLMALAFVFSVSGLPAAQPKEHIDD
jgi:hypothetical protein